MSQTLKAQGFVARCSECGREWIEPTVLYLPTTGGAPPPGWADRSCPWCGADESRIEKLTGEAK